jgi:hypothetical protein
MAGEMQANRAWQRDQPGHYVVNATTDIAVAGPLSYDEARAEMLRRNGPPGPPILEVREVSN